MKLIITGTTGHVGKVTYSTYNNPCILPFASTVTYELTTSKVYSLESTLKRSTLITNFNSIN